jgi:HSP20 family protein
MFSLIKPNGDNRLPLEQEWLRLWKPIFQGNLSVFGEELEQVVPRVNLVEDETEYRVSAELPGVDEKDVHVSLTPDGLTISGEKKQESEEKGKNVYRFERSFGTFKRLIRLPEDVDRTKVAATFKKGLLKIALPKRADAAPRNIEIKGE